MNYLRVTRKDMSIWEILLAVRGRTSNYGPQESYLVQNIDYRNMSHRIEMDNIPENETRTIRCKCFSLALF